MYIEALQQEIVITSQEEACARINDSTSRNWNVCSICNTQDCSAPPFVHAAGLKQLFFDDVLEDWPASRYLAAEPEHIGQAIKFSRKIDHAPLLIHCRAGVSRSTALAWILVYDKLRDSPEAARQSFDIIKAVRPCLGPNTHVLKLGINCLVEDFEQRQKLFAEFQACLIKPKA